jgi:signal transduction histidine kinase
VKDRIFEPGFTTKKTGWGVGLSLTRRIVEDLHEGSITVRDRRGGGAAFVLSLPVDPSAAAVQRVIVTEQPASAVRRPASGSADPPVG